MQSAPAIAHSLSLINQTLRHNLTTKAPEKKFSRQLMEILGHTVDTLSALPLLTCEAIKGDCHQAIPVVAAWQLLRLAAKLLDDVVDGESTDHPPNAIDFAASLLFLAPLVLEELQNRDLSTNRIASITRSLHQTGLRACVGQYTEISSHNHLDPDGWLTVARMKSGNPYAWAAWSGAMVAGADRKVLADFHKFGLHLGILLQVADDFNDIWQPSNFNDLKSGQFNLAVCYARLIVEGQQKDFLETSLKDARSGDDAAEKELRQFLIQIGAQAYLLVVGGKHRQEALASLRRNGGSSALVELLNQVWPVLANGGLHVE